MEPMTLGSPIGSPMSSPVGTSPLNVGTGSMNSASFYPSYLIGDTHASSINRISQAGGISPGRPQIKKCPTQHFSPTASSHPVRDRFFHSTRPIGDRHFGPPTSPLIGGLPQSPSNKTAGASFLDTSKITNTSLNSSTTHQLLNNSTSGELNRTSDILIETDTAIEGQHCWVTVFGFPYASASFILTQFSQSGTIIEHKQPNSGNWMHIKFQSSIQAKRALGRNGKIISGNTMIGVIPCTDKSVICSGESSFVNDCSIVSLDDSLHNTPKAHLRPLTQAYQSSRTTMEVTPESRTPRKTEGIIAKTINSILGL